MQSRLCFLSFALTMLTVHHAQAAVDSEAAQQLREALTPWGAERAGNADGSIPAYTGTVKPAASFNPATPGERPDPFAGEQPIVTITASNMAQFRDKLSEGAQALLQKYPSFRMDVYPSHRTANYPQWVQENSIKNATRCKTINGGLGVADCFGGVPFPIAKDGYEVMWNKLLRFESPSFAYRGQGWFVTPTGVPVLQAENMQTMEYPYYDKSKTSFGATDSYWLYRIDYKKPTRKAGESLMLHDSIDPVNTGRRVWQYIPGQRRIKLAPDVAYDTPSPESAGAANVDDGVLFNGALDRFDWKLVGKKELYIPYNDFKLNDPKQCPTSRTLVQGTLLPDCVRWELHRVWVVEATLKAGARHNYHKRVFYFDEDVFTGISDNYDSAGKLYRTAQTFYSPRYESDGHDATTTVVYDLSSGAYSTLSYKVDVGGTYDVPKKDARFWSPDAMAASSAR